MRHALATALVALSVLTACATAEFNELANEGVDLIDDIADLPLTAVSAMPTGGSSTYLGTAGLTFDDRLSEDERNDLLGDLTMLVDFDNNDITGQIDGIEAQDGSVTGTIGITGGTLFGNSFGAEASGAITLPDETAAIAIDMDMAGVFRGEAAEGMSGSGSGTYTQDDGSGDIFMTFGAQSGN